MKITHEQYTAAFRQAMANSLCRVINETLESGRGSDANVFQRGDEVNFEITVDERVCRVVTEDFRTFRCSIDWIDWDGNEQSEGVEEGDLLTARDCLMGNLEESFPA